MTEPKIQSLSQLEAEMRAVARGEKPAPKDAAQPSFNSVEALIRLLTPENRQLMAIIRDNQPASITALAKMTGRAAPNLTRTLQKLEAAGLIKIKTDKRTKRPVPAVRALRLQIDPFSEHDVLEYA